MLIIMSYDVTDEDLIDVGLKQEHVDIGIISQIDGLIVLEECENTIDFMKRHFKSYSDIKLEKCAFRGKKCIVGIVWH